MEHSLMNNISSASKLGLGAILARSLNVVIPNGRANAAVVDLLGAMSCLAPAWMAMNVRLITTDD